jgi:sugar O-acyltransferase (sialic acid O-acetyltransferase NeuD family)
MTRRLIIAGAGEHARVVTDVARVAGWEPIGCIGPRPPDATGGAGKRGLTWLGTDETMADQLAALPAADRPALILGVGAPAALRRSVVATLGPAAYWATVVHPAAWVSSEATLGPGTVVLANAVVNTGALIGSHVIINSGAIVEHDARVGNHAHIAPGATLGGGVVIGEDVLVGLNASVRDHLSVGAGAVVAMGAAAVADVPAGAVVLGVPARG